MHVDKELWHEIYTKELWNAYLAFYQFYFTEDVIDKCHLTNILKLMDWKLACGEYHLWHLQYPNNNLDNILINCEYFSDEFLPRTIICKYKKMKILYEKILSVEDNSEAWFTALQDVNDDEFVKHNVEHRFGENMNDKMLWKMYIDFLKGRDEELMLHTYSKYCRFFINDIKIKIQYEKAVKEFGQKLKVTWEGMFKFEQCGSKVIKTLVNNLRRRNVKSRNELLPLKNELTHNRKRKALLHFSYDCVRCQNFSFKNSFVNYMFQTSDKYVRQALFKTCKYFFSKHPFPICYKLSITNSLLSDDQKEEIVKESLYLKSETSILNFMNLHVTSFFNFESNTKNFGNLLKKVYRCSAKSVSIINTKLNLTFNELKFLIGHGNVIYLDLCEILCTDEETGKSVVMEDILRLTPKIQFFDIWNPVFSPQSAQILTKLAFKNKIHKFWFFSENNAQLDPISFSQFIIANATDNCEINYFRGVVQTEFDRILEAAILEHWRGKRKPYFYKTT